MRKTAISRSSTIGSSSTRPSIIRPAAWYASRHHPELERALEEGVWADGEPPSERCSTATAALPQPDRVRIRAWAEVAASYLITDPRCVDALTPYHVWTSDYASKRLAWKRRHPLHVILLRTYRIPRPVTVKVRDEYGGCNSWVELHRELPFEGTPVLSDDEFERACGRDRGDRLGRSPAPRLEPACRRGATAPRHVESDRGLGRRPSLSFSARHESAHAEQAGAVLDDLEEFRNDLTELFEVTPSRSPW